MADQLRPEAVDGRRWWRCPKHQLCGVLECDRRLPHGEQHACEMDEDRQDCPHQPQCCALITEEEAIKATVVSYAGGRYRKVLRPANTGCSGCAGEADKLLCSKLPDCQQRWHYKREKI